MATVYTLMGGKDLVNGAYHYQWQVRTTYSVFLKKKLGDTKYYKMKNILYILLILLFTIFCPK